MRDDAPRGTARRAGWLASLPLTWAWCLSMGAPAPQLSVLSSRADTVSAGDALVQLSAPASPSWTVQLNDDDVTGSFRQVAGSSALVARLSGLKLGKNALTLRVAGRQVSTLELLNHPQSGPIFSGPHQQPFICQTALNGLGPPQDADCFAKTIVRYYYKSTQSAGAPAAGPDTSATPGALTAGFKAYDPEAPRPHDVAHTLTSSGQTVDYIVRREVGVVNRAVYDIQLLHTPAEPLADPWTPSRGGWNGRLVYEFKGGCGPGYRQGVLPDPLGAVQEPLLAQGYAIASSTLNSFENNCNDRISAETLSMVKEHFIETFGTPVHTIGWGGSGGAMQVHLIAQNYPGLLDGIIALASFPDLPTFLQWATDCRLLDRAFKSSQAAWTQAQKTAVSGLATWNQCDIFLRLGLSYVDPRKCDPAIPPEQIYERGANPQGARCDIYSNEINIFGRDPRTGFARRPLDNVGVQYGLVAFNQARISAQQFVELNERVGGYDADGHLIAARTEADPQTLRLAYERGLVLSGGGGLKQVPIIDWRAYSDDLGGADIHVRFLSFVTRSRLFAANGRVDNQIMLLDPREAWFEWTRHYWGPMGELVPHMDRWLDQIAADRATADPSDKIARAVPADLQERCVATDGERIVEAATYEGRGACDQLYPAHADPRIAAGAPLADDVLKCQLKPLRATDYARPLSAAQLGRLQAVFAGGVCDFSRPGVGQALTRATWQRFH